MATTDWDLAGTFQIRFPHTFNSLQQLVMAMAKYEKNRGKKTLFGKDKGLNSYKKFEDVLRDTLLAMVVDGVVPRNVAAKECRVTLTEMIGAFAEVFPNWQDAYSFAENYFIKNAGTAEARIEHMLAK
ncbi:MAG: hypothetical protein AB2805_03830 [Candidatus Thiodiazotropha sp.]